MAARLLGAHMHTSKGLHKAVLDGAEIGCTAIQVFTSSPQQWRSRDVTPDMVRELQKSRQQTGITQIVSHDSYLINLCAPTEEIRTKSFNALKRELMRCGQLGIPFVVSHMGAHHGAGEAEGLLTIAEAVNEILAESPDTVTLLMETTAGHGSWLNGRFEHLAVILEECAGHARLGVCVDTCHIFVAGYDIRTAEGYERTFTEFDRLVGCERIKTIHCNDSKKGLGSRVDRHAHIGEGELGLEPFRCLVNDQRFENTPILLETPDPDEMHAKNLDTLRSLIA